MKDTIRISDQLSFLTGEGLEFLVRDEVVIAKFIDGNLYFGSQEVANQEKTIPPIECTNG